MTRVPSNSPPFAAVPTITPLERLTLSPQLDGSLLPRGSQVFKLRIDARNDLEAIEMWLAEVAKSEATFRSYRLEAERCLLWATVERRKPLTALNGEDILDYWRFLLDPQPRERWLSVGFTRREEESWRPFHGPLSLRSRDRALKILFSMFEWLETVGYLRENPCRHPALACNSIDKKDREPAAVSERDASVTSVVEWSYIRKALEELEADRDEVAAARTKAVLYLAYFADMKPGEICSLCISAISVLASNPVPVWKLEIEGRAPERREIVLLPPVQQALERYLACRGITFGMGAPRPDCPVIASSRGIPDCHEVEANLSGAGSFTKHVFMRAAALAHAGGDQLATRRLSGATMHWLRHAFEVHTVHLNMSGNWCWLLLGACWLAPPIMRAYLPPRMPLLVNTALEAFEDLRRMWVQHG